MLRRRRAAPRGREDREPEQPWEVSGLRFAPASDVSLLASLAVDWPRVRARRTRPPGRRAGARRVNIRAHDLRRLARDRVGVGTLMTIAPVVTWPARAGVPTTLILRSEDAQGCVRSFLIPSRGIEAVLPAEGETRIDLGVLEPGTLRYSCGMGMYTGTITAA